jgi:hypothetical protein
MYMIRSVLTEYFIFLDLDSRCTHRYHLDCKKFQGKMTRANDMSGSSICVNAPDCNGAILGC